MPRKKVPSLSKLGNLKKESVQGLACGNLCVFASEEKQSSGFGT